MLKFASTCALLMGLGLMWGQNPSTIPMSAPPPPAPTNVSATVVGAGQRIYYYWIVANYPIGKVITPNSTQVFNGPNSFDVSHHVLIGWTAQTGATSYDILRTNTATLPSGTTTSSVATGLTVTSFDDTVSSPGSYTLSPVAQTVTGAISIDNTNFPTARINWTLPAVNTFPFRLLSPTFLTIGAGVNQLPTAGASNLGYIAVVNDASSFCAATGGGSALSTLMSNGSAWVSICGSGGGGGGTGTAATYTTVTFSATPTFSVTANTGQSFLITLTGNVTSSTVDSSGITSSGKPITTFTICQDGTGSRTFAWPANVLNHGTILGTANACSTQTFVYDGTNYQALGVMMFTGGTPGLNIPGSTSGSANVVAAATAGGTFTVPQRSGTVNFASTTGSLTNGHGVVIDANQNFVDSGSAPTGGGPGVSVYKSALQAIPGTTDTPLTWTNTEWDTSGGALWVIGSPTIVTVNSTGRWNATCGTRADNSTDAFIYFKVNGVTPTPVDPQGGEPAISGSTTGIAGVTHTFSLTSGDTIQCNVFFVTGANTQPTQTFFTVYKVF